MEIIKIICWIVQIISAMSIIVLVLLQHGKGADAGATFGASGGSGSLFGASGSTNFLSRTTAVFAVIFFVTTFSLVLLSSNNKLNTNVGVMAGLNGKIVSSAPVVTSSSAPKMVVKKKQNEIPE